MLKCVQNVASIKLRSYVPLCTGCRSETWHRLAETPCRVWESSAVSPPTTKSGSPRPCRQPCRRPPLLINGGASCIRCGMRRCHQLQQPRSAATCGPPLPAPLRGQVLIRLQRLETALNQCNRPEYTARPDYTPAYTYTLLAIGSEMEIGHLS